MTDILKIIFVDNIRDLGRALEIRDQVFVKGQGVDSVLENDGLDSIQDIHNGNAVVILAFCSNCCDNFTFALPIMNDHVCFHSCFNS